MERQEMTPQQFAVELKKHGSIKGVFRANRVSWHRLRGIYEAAVALNLVERRGVGRLPNERIKEEVVPDGNVKAIETRKVEMPKPGEVKRYILTCAQNNTKLHEPFWQNLLALREHYKAELHVSRFYYLKVGLGASGDKDKITVRIKSDMGNNDNIKWDDRLTPYLSDKRLEIAPALVWCGEMNTLPTAVRPLSGLEVYTGRKSGIFPHVKIAMESIASTRGEPTKFNYTTGTVTQRNYIQRKAGLKAEFHHCYGALLVEVCEDGWFCRQLHADSEGVIHDLDVKVSGGSVTTDNHVEGITWGDCHVAEGERGIFDLAWGTGGVLDQLRPKHQLFHDVLHFRGRSHHEIKNPHTMFKRHVQGHENVREELERTAEFLDFAKRDWCQNVIVGSNHDRHIARWLQEQDGRDDPINAQFWLKLNSRMYEAMGRNKERINCFREALHVIGWVNDHTFLHEDDSYVICNDEHGGIECGQHGDLGPNGSHGNIKTFARLGRRTNIGHSHSAGICDGAYQAGTFGILDPDWTHGPSSWSHSFIVTYPNGKRTIITIWKGRWRA